ncbi:hypothetical protein [Bradyrhizobium genosp. P]|uniref:hypothetical protein n=1 Tax=Bradyrhizobium genosp. P TaxID=83641 RepID=UPI003CF49FC2
MESQQVIIHARFAPTRTVAVIGEHPAEVTPHQLFDVLRNRAGDTYERFIGRGVFRTTRAAVDAFRREARRIA